MKHKFFYLIQTAGECGEHEHPQIVIRKYYPDATHFQPESIADGWIFAATPIQPKPAFVIDNGSLDNSYTRWDEVKRFWVLR